MRKKRLQYREGIKELWLRAGKTQWMRRMVVGECTHLNDLTWPEIMQRFIRIDAEKVLTRDK